MNKRKQILIISDWFAPGFKAGGPIKSTVNIAFALKSDYNIKVLTTDTDHGELLPYPGIEPDKWINNIDSQVGVYYARKTKLSLKQLRKQIEETDADFVYLNHIWSPYFVLFPLWLKYRGIIKGKLIVCPRGGLYDSALSVRSYKKWPVLRLMNWLNIKRYVVFHATNNREKAAIERFFSGSKIVVADNLPTFYQQEFSTCIKERGAVKCIFVSRIVAIKNLLFLLDALASVKQKITLSIVGPIEDAEYWKLCKKKMNTLPGNIIVDYLGPKSNSQISPLILQHHLFVLPTTGENFGHSIFESFLAGRPVLISDQTPWLQLLEKDVGWDLPLNDKENFRVAIEEAAGWGQADFDKTAYSSWLFAKTHIENSDVKEQYHRMFS